MALLTHARGPTQELERTFYIAAAAVFLVGLFWKRVYANPFFQWQAIPFAFLAAYVGALIRHSPFSSFYAAIFIVAEAIGVIGWLLSRHGGATDGSACGSGPDDSNASTK
jgi:hypothetical protein